jgi:Ca-activated chloride channel family protein
MTTDIDETMLTAYALNELSEQNRAVVDLYLMTHDQAPGQLAEIRTAIEMISAELAEELAGEPASARVVSPGGPAPLRVRHRSRWATAAIGLAAAAAMAAGVSFYVQHANRTSHAIFAFSSQYRNSAASHPQPVSALPGIVSAKQPITGPLFITGQAVDIADAPENHDPRYQLSKDQVVAGLMQDARQYADDGKYTESLAVIHHIQTLDPANTYANSVRGYLQDKLSIQRRIQLAGRFNDEFTNSLSATNSRVIPYEDVVRWPDERSKIAPTDDEVSADRGAVAEDASLQSQLDRHLPELRFNANALSDVVDFLRDVNGTNITVDWNALAKAGITRNTPITALLRDIKFCDALALILKSANTGAATAQPGYKLDHGAISISVGPTFGLTEPANTGETYNQVIDNPFLVAKQNPLSTFAVDVDTASYSNVRRFLDHGLLPPADAVRIEELINYFPYSYPPPKANDPAPISVNVELAECPWAPTHRLARIALKAKAIAPHEHPASNLVFLIDVSGSMADANKLPMLKVALKNFVNRLSDTDHVSIVTYAGNAAIALPSTPCGDEDLPATAEENAADQQAITQMWDQVYVPQIYYRNGQPVNGAEVKAAFDKAVANLPKKMVSSRDRILAAIDSLNADGETNGGDGIQMAYRTAVSNFLKEGVNRVILATDGDFNVGVTNPDDLVKMIEAKSQSGVYLTVLGLGMGNVKDATMEKLASHGKGNYAYLDSLAEADKVLGRQIDSTLITVAKDVKLQIEFNPAQVSSYRLIGYEHRAMAAEAFYDDRKTAGEMGAGRSVTALYDIVPTTSASGVPLKYQLAPPPATNRVSGELMTVKVAYQPPTGGASRKIELAVQDHPEQLTETTNDFRFASAVAAFGMILRDSPYKGTATLDQVHTWAAGSRGEDAGGYRSQFLDLVARASLLRK